MLARKTLKIYHHKCVYCGVAFTSSSPCSKTCKPAHRTAISRWRSKLPKLFDQVAGNIAPKESMIQQIGFYLDFPDARQDAILALKAISDEINNQLNIHNIRRVK
jgi:hypothetical protein